MGRRPIAQYRGPKNNNFELFELGSSTFPKKNFSEKNFFFLCFAILLAKRSVAKQAGEASEARRVL